MPGGGDSGEPGIIHGVIAAAIAAAVVAAYAGTWGAPFVFDDWQSVVANPTLRRLGDLAAVLTPDRGTTAGRPVLNLSYALNHAVGGAAVGGYHAGNWAIHVAAALLLFGLVRRTLLLPRCGARLNAVALPAAAAVAAVWAVHPLNTESVTYISERAESLMGVFYLLTLYAFVRGWRVAAAVACACGVATKEVMVTAPVVVLLYDRAFLSESFAGALRRRRGFYVMLGACWALLAVLMSAFPIADRAVGFGVGVSPLRYAATEAVAVWRYAALAVWPRKLIFDYGPDAWVGSGEAAAAAAGLVLVLATIAVIWRRSPALAFLPAAFFALLAPTSSVVPIALQPVAESRMYLPLAAMVAAAVVALFWVGGGVDGVGDGADGVGDGADGVGDEVDGAEGRVDGAGGGVDDAAGRRRFLGSGRLRRRDLWLLSLAAVAALGLATAARNRTYGDAVALWRDTVAKAPGNPRAQNSLGTALAAAGQQAQAEAAFAAALRVDPQYAPAHFNVGVAALNANRAAEAVPHLRLALGAPQQQAEAHLYLGQALLGLGRFSEAVPPLQYAARALPDSMEACFDLANALFGADRLDEAVEEYRRALRLKPNDATVESYLRRAESARRASGRP